VGGIDWIGLAQYRDKWMTHMNAVMNLWSYVKCWEVHEWLNNWWPLEECLVP
jgi:hypothetical protein